MREEDLATLPSPEECRDPMRVAVICSVVPPDRAPEAEHAWMLCEEMAAAGCSVTLVTRAGATPPAPGNFGVRAVMRSWGWRGLPRLRRELERIRPDAVLLIYLGWIYGRHPMITFLPTICRRLPHLPRVVVQFENTGGADPRRFTHRVGRKLAAKLAGEAGVEYRFGTLLRDSDAVIALCRPHLRELARHHPAVAAKASVVPAPPLIRIQPDPAGEARLRARAAAGYAPDDFVLAYFGYLYPEKGVETVLEAAGRAREAVPALRLVMVGGPPDNLADRDPAYPRRLRERARDCGLAERTHWAGHCDTATVIAHLRAADACLLPFTQGVRLNNSSFAVLAALGLPVLTTRGTDLEPEFRDRENVLLFPPGDTAAAAAAIVELASSPPLRHALRIGALEFARGRSSGPAVVRETLRILFPLSL
jgi:glycosyltransferase involved in cell wall biosynthesis